VPEEMNLNDYAEIFQHNWLDLSQHYPDVQLDAFLILPNQKTVFGFRLPIKDCNLTLDWNLRITM
jgi:hypothetical protein